MADRVPNIFQPLHCLSPTSLATNPCHKLELEPKLKPPLQHRARSSVSCNSGTGHIAGGWYCHHVPWVRARGAITTAMCSRSEQKLPLPHAKGCSQSCYHYHVLQVTAGACHSSFLMPQTRASQQETLQSGSRRRLKISPCSS